MLNALDAWLDVMHNFLMFARFPIEFIVNKTSVSVRVTYYFVVSHISTLTHCSTLRMIRKMDCTDEMKSDGFVFSLLFEFIGFSSNSLELVVLVIIELRATTAKRASFYMKELEVRS